MIDDPPIGEEAFRAMFLKHRDGRRDAFSLWAELVRKNWTEKQLRARPDVGGARGTRRDAMGSCAAALPTKEAKR